MRNRGSTPEEGDREIAGFSEFGQDHIEIREVVKSVGNTLGKHFFVSRHSPLGSRNWHFRDGAIWSTAMNDLVRSVQRVKLVACQVTE